MEDGVNIGRCRKAAGKAVAKASVFCLVSMACISALVHCKLLVAVSLEKPESMERQGDVAAMIGGWRAKRPDGTERRDSPETSGTRQFPAADSGITENAGNAGAGKPQETGSHVPVPGVAAGDGRVFASFAVDSATDGAAMWAPGRFERPVSSSEASAINDAMDAELEADEIPTDYGVRMEAQFRDMAVDETVRNFAVQHLERFAQERTVRGTWDVSSAEAGAVRKALRDASLETGNSIGGTAMLALVRLSEIDQNVDSRKLGARATALVADSSAPVSARLASAQICGILRHAAALPALRSVVADVSLPLPLRRGAERALADVDRNGSGGPAP